MELVGDLHSEYVTKDSNWTIDMPASTFDNSATNSI